MARRTKKTTKSTKRTPLETLESWCQGQTDTQEARDEARESWEAGQSVPVNFTDEFGQVFHIEKCYLESGGYIVVVWDDNGDMTFGGM